MKKNIIPVCEIPELTIGLDLSDRTFQFCELNAAGRDRRGRRAQARPADSLRKYLAAQPRARASRWKPAAQSAWVKRLIEQLGHEAVVANARELQAVTGRSHRSDHHDARQLARLARVDGELLNPVRLRGSASNRPTCS